MKLLTTEDLVSIYKRENSALENEFFRTQTRFDDYVADYCFQGNKSEENLTDDELLECAYNFLTYDN